MIVIWLTPPPKKNVIVMSQQNSVHILTVYLSQMHLYVIMLQQQSS